MTAKEHVSVSNPAKEAALNSSGLTISRRDDVAMTHVALRRGRRADLDARTSATLGLSLPDTPHTVEAAGKTVVWAGPEQWIVIEPQIAGTDASAALAKAFNGIASVVDVSDSRVVFRVRGTTAAEVLSPSMAIDFHDSAFKPGAAAITHANHLGVIVWRHADGQGYDFACARTYAVDFSHWLEDACSKVAVFA
jgi:heterotetrameric sarcosine oxidase gamma subunit